MREPFIKVTFNAPGLPRALKVVLMQAMGIPASHAIGTALRERRVNASSASSNQAVQTYSDNQVSKTKHRARRAAHLEPAIQPRDIAGDRRPGARS